MIKRLTKILGFVLILLLGFSNISYADTTYTSTDTKDSMQFFAVKNELSNQALTVKIKMIGYNQKTAGTSRILEFPDSIPAGKTRVYIRNTAGQSGTLGLAYYDTDGSSYGFLAVIREYASENPSQGNIRNYRNRNLGMPGPINPPLYTWTTDPGSSNAITFKYGDGNSDIMLMQGKSGADYFYKGVTGCLGTDQAYRGAQGVTTYGTISITVPPQDQTAPTVSLSANPAGWTNGNVTLNGTVTDAGTGTIGYQITTSSTATSYTPVTATTSTLYPYTTTSTEGATTWYLHAKDNAGNTSRTNTTVYIDKTAPTAGTINMTVNGNAYASNTWATGNVVVSIANGSDSLSGHYSTSYQLDGVTAVPAGTTAASTLQNEGTTTVTLSTRDNAGNYAYAYATIKIDKTAPVIGTVTNNTQDWTNGSVAFTVDYSDATSGVSKIVYSYDKSKENTDWDTNNTTRVSKTWSTQTNSTIYFRAYDVAGNVSAWSSGYHIRIDTTKPSLSNFALSTTVTNQNSVKASITATDSGSSNLNRVEFRAWSGSGAHRTTINGTAGSSNSYSATFTLTSIVDAATNSASGQNGTYYIEVYAFDNAGNYNNVAALSVVYDTLPPTGTTISINNDAKYTNSRNVTLTLSASDSGSGMGQMAISNQKSVGTYETYATSKAWTLTAGSGVKTVYVIYKDKAGNTTAAFN